MRIFHGLQVQYGVDRDGDGSKDIRPVPIVYGLPDRVVASRLNNDGVFQASRVPLMSVYLTGITPNGETRKAPRHTENIPYQKDDGSYGAISRCMGVPYKANADLYLYASNSDQMLQMKEQILLLFNPDLSFQVSDNIRDWSYITRVVLESINNEASFPMGEQDRLIQESMSFSFDFWLNFPVAERSAIIAKIEANIKGGSTGESVDLDQLIIEETGGNP